MTSRRARHLDPAAADLLLSVVETPAAVVTGQVLDGYHAAAGRVLKSLGFLEPWDEQRASPSLIDHEDEPIELIWSGEHGGYGYFSPAAGWVTVPTSQLASFRVNLGTLFKHVLGRLGGMTHDAATVLVPDLLWEVGDVRLPGRGKRVPIWIARRLGDPVVWKQFTEAARLRPAPGLRIVLAFTAADRLHARMMGGHEVVAVRDVATSDSLIVDPDLLAARVTEGARQADEVITMAADGASVIVRGNRYVFGGSKQRAIIRYLYAAWKSGKPECPTVEVLEAAEYSRSVNTLAKAFSGRKDWRDFIKEEHGSCRMFS